MQDFAQQAQVALSLYLKRSSLLLEKLEAKDYEGALELLSLQKAAFLNFKVADHLVKKYQLAYSETELADLWTEIDNIRPSLEKALAKSLRLLENKFLKISKQKINLHNFQSGMSHSSTFEKTV